MGPAGLAAMDRGRVLGYGGMAATHATQQMPSDPLTSVEQLAVRSVMLASTCWCRKQCSTE